MEDRNAGKPGRKQKGEAPKNKDPPNLLFGIVWDGLGCQVGFLPLTWHLGGYLEDQLPPKLPS